MMVESLGGLAQNWCSRMPAHRRRGQKPAPYPCRRNQAGTTGMRCLKVRDFRGSPKPASFISPILVCTDTKAGIPGAQHPVSLLPAVIPSTGELRAATLPCPSLIFFSGSLSPTFSSSFILQLKSRNENTFPNSP